MAVSMHCLASLSQSILVRRAIPELLDAWCHFPITGPIRLLVQWKRRQLHAGTLVDAGAAITAAVR